ncbi:Fic family protein [soil metagenome]
MVAKNAVLTTWPAVFLSDTATSAKVSKAVKRGELVKIGPRLYTSKVEEAPERVVSLHLWEILRLLYSGSVVGYRSALHAKPTPEGKMFLVGAYPRTDKLPGATVRVLKGPGPLPGDIPYGGGMYLASPARALLECLSGKRITAESPTLARAELEAFVERRIRTAGERWANEVRDRARKIAPDLGLEEEAEYLRRMIGAMLGTVRAALTAPAAVARAAGAPYDADRVARFDRLVEALRDYPIPHREDRDLSGEPFYNLAFFDAYFSNYIEGTRFPVGDAREIVFEGKIPVQRVKDAHDVIGTYRVLSSRHEMFVSTSEWIERPQLFLDVLRERHRMMMQERPEVRPGEFKDVQNQAGDTLFVDPGLVESTLTEGLWRLALLDRAFQRAVFMMFLVSEVHPFDDGNGRLARAMMNAELVSQGERRILIPTAYRIDYMGALRRLTRQDDPSVLLRALDRAQDFTHRIDFADYERARATLETYGAFGEGEEARIRMPPKRGSQDVVAG